jgi:hypothetical protein
MSLNGLGLFGKECLRPTTNSYYNQALQSILTQISNSAKNPEFIL